MDLRGVACALRSSVGFIGASVRLRLRMLRASVRKRCQGSVFQIVAQGRGHRGLSLRGAVCDGAGQGTVELAAMLPIVLIVVVIAVNACTFFSECASFDRLARQAVRVHATSLTYGEGSTQATARIKQNLGDQFNKSNESIDVWAGGESGGCVRYTAKLNYSTTLFGMGLKSEIFGVQVPPLTHEVQLVVDPYNPGVLFG